MRLCTPACSLGFSVTVNQIGLPTGDLLTQALSQAISTSLSSSHHEESLASPSLTTDQLLCDALAPRPSMESCCPPTRFCGLVEHVLDAACGHRGRESGGKLLGVLVSPRDHVPAAGTWAPCGEKLGRMAGRQTETQERDAVSCPPLQRG